jgi:antitoxin VapB
MSEVQISGLIAAQALDQGITPIMLLVGVDERIYRYRHPIPTQKQLERYAMLAICGRRWGWWLRRRASSTSVRSQTS